MHKIIPMKTEFGICYQAFIPVRSEPDDRSEQVTQVLFGEQFRILETSANFCLIEMSFDRYRGWIDAKTIHYLEGKRLNNLENSTLFVTSDAFTHLNSLSGDPSIMLSAGSTLYVNHGRIDTGSSVYEAPRELVLTKPSNPGDSIVTSALNLLNVPYLWGGRSSFGTDCSGLVQNVFKQAGIALPRDASVQAGCGKILNFLSEAVPGDLAFFDNADGNIVHVGIILAGNRIIHASGKVRIDRLDHQGIFNTQRNNYSHKLRVVKRIITAEN
jgi:cell wall-associated NlpC family hydrolase